MRITTLIFDLDDTLYPAECGLWPLISDRMEQYMLERMHIPAEQVSGLRRRFSLEYGTTMRGLQNTYGIDNDDFLAYVHDVPVEERVRPIPGLREVLATLPHRKVIFTNADRRHARRVLRALGLSDIFEQVADVTDVQPYCKPMPEAFRLALEHLGEPDPTCCLFADDSSHNLRGAQAVGIHTLLVGPPPEAPNGHLHVASLLDLPRVLETLEAHNPEENRDH